MPVITPNFFRVRKQYLVSVFSSNKKATGAKPFYQDFGLFNKFQKSKCLSCNIGPRFPVSFRSSFPTIYHKGPIRTTIAVPLFLYIDDAYSIVTFYDLLLKITHTRFFLPEDIFEYFGLVKKYLVQCISINNVEYIYHYNKLTKSLKRVSISRSLYYTVSHAPPPPPLFKKKGALCSSFFFFFFFKKFLYFF